LKKFYLFLTVLICFALLQWGRALAAGGADYGRGPETDPVASAAVSVLTTNLSGANIKSGNIPVAALTNAAGSVGASIGGNIPVAALTNAVTALAGASITNTCIAADGKTNTYIFVSFGGKYVISSITTSP